MASTPIDHKTTFAPRVRMLCTSCYAEGKVQDFFCNAEDAAEVTLSALHHGPAGPECEELECEPADWLPVSHSISAAEAVSWAELYEETGDDDWPALCAWVQDGSADGEHPFTDRPTYEAFRDHYRGLWDTFEDYARDLAEQTCLMEGWGETAKSYFSWTRYSRDLAYDHTIIPDVVHGRGVFVFTV